MAYKKGNRGLGYNHDGSSYSFPIKKEHKDHPQVKEASAKLKKMANKVKK